MHLSIDVVIRGYGLQLAFGEVETEDEDAEESDSGDVVAAVLSEIGSGKYELAEYEYEYEEEEEEEPEFAVGFCPPNRRPS